LNSTNCHIVLEEGPPVEDLSPGQKPGYCSFTLSAKTKESLRRLVQEWRTFLTKTPRLDPVAVCSTLHMGRMHHEYRLAVIIRQDIKELKEYLDFYMEQGEETDMLIAGEFRIIPGKSTKQAVTDLTEGELEVLHREAGKLVDEYLQSGQTDPGLLRKINHLYVRGAEIPWNLLYRDTRAGNLPLPVYTFEKKRCWIKDKKERNGGSLIGKPLCESLDMTIYSTVLAPGEHWLLYEHRIHDNYVLPGTTHVEMVVEAALERCPRGFVLSNVQFITPVIIPVDESADIHTGIRKTQKGWNFYTASVPGTTGNSTDGLWQKHIQGEISPLDPGETFPVRRIEQLKERIGNHIINPDIDAYNRTTGFNFGSHWKNIRKIWMNNNELLTLLKIPGEYEDELLDYPLHPSLFDNALATVPIIEQKKEVLGLDNHELFFLPFSFKSIGFYKPLVPEFYSHVKLKYPVKPGDELCTFDITLMDTRGNVLVEISEYSIKLTRSTQLFTKRDENCFYKIIWKPAVPGEKMNHIPETLVFVRRADQSVAGLQEKLATAGSRVIDVVMGDGFKVLGPSSYEVGNTTESFVELFQNLAVEGGLSILHFSSVRSDVTCNTLDELDKAISLGIENVFHLTRALVQQGYKEHVDLVLFSNHVHRVTGKEKALNTPGAGLFGFGKVIPGEYPGIHCRCVDIEIPHLDSPGGVESLSTEILGPGNPFIAAWREGTRHTPELTALDQGRISPPASLVKEGGVYIITGGLGGIGLEIAHALAQEERCTLVLLNRSEFPGPSAWDAILTGNGDEKIKEKILKLKQIEELGAVPVPYACDVADPEALEKTLEAIRREYTKINGVIHSAGIGGDGFIIKKELEDVRKVCAPKIEGTWLLDHLTARDNLDFFIIFSSDTTLKGVPGQSDYTAANSFQDAFAFDRTLRGSGTLTINWPAWLETGMAFEHNTNKDGIVKAMPTKKGLKAFRRIAGSDLCQVYVGEFNRDWKQLADVLQDMDYPVSPEIIKEFTTRETQGGEEPVIRPVNQEIQLKGKEKDRYSKTEKIIASIWNEVLGYDEYDVHSNFFEIGGDSILITQVHTLLEKSFPGKIQIGELFSYPTIASIAEIISPPGDMEDTIEKADADKEENIDETIENLYRDLEDGVISIDEAHTILTGKKDH
jgi:NAD(P)-dependent dehydrogenase (short-subunit alcohol dehydrogenase family)